MNKVYQTRFGGKDTPIEQQGNCFQACVATILQIPLEEAFDCIEGIAGTDLEFDQNREWLGKFNKWLEQYGLGCIFFETSKEHPVACTAFVGMHIAECTSNPHLLLLRQRHAVVMQDGQLLHDPNPNVEEQDEVTGVYIFVPLRPYELVRKGAVND